MKVGGFCKEGPGAERAGRRCLPEKGNQSRQLSGVPRGGTEALTPGRAGSPGLPPSLDRQSVGPGQPLHLRSLLQPQPHRIQGGRVMPATPTLLRCRCPWADPSRPPSAGIFPSCPAEPNSFGKRVLAEKSAKGKQGSR